MPRTDSQFFGLGGDEWGRRVARSGCLEAHRPPDARGVSRSVLPD
jgi:hypothetical protein